MAKLTKAQREFFYDFAKNDLSNALFPILHAQGIQMTSELAEELLNMVDLNTYTEIVGSAFLERVDFATIKRVDKIMKSDEFNNVIVASHQVSDAVNDERIRILMAMIPEADKDE
ncbi:hypothetical protein phiPsa267_049 [Pseudomonas phage phiPsa267]|jgi:hypothetical protein|uniref:Uncharacterized protein n=9 Tax=Otagovirus TaxID=2560197 RepID=A0A7G9V0Z4_9CAUD|nr:hypothetical protein CF96_gp047 [Pseudomonas phage phiPsa374]YP_010766776.1 PhoH-like protein [Pseudomonas phage psageK4]YP_010766959.1 hypothetical protein QGX15_gp054 [Pseudomonas phage psageK4e]YP_010767138.1 hypothetical protein QGX16_gp048 [Pseudomonas phage phiPsa397]YP_010767310.1 hypothetical protein QGX17_gp047 [Pseudomonas phage phiPsa381]YP_010767486.1 hypothetical protein QGX18_gp050 [Pseudomonas phage phiPsa347]YP_010767659.1 hypothetical protein QGX19_gp049 [Pseudomonas phage